MKDIKDLTVGDWVLCDTPTVGQVDMCEPRRVSRLANKTFSWEIIDDIGPLVENGPISSIRMAFSGFKECYRVYRYALEENAILQAQNTLRLLLAHDKIINKANEWNENEHQHPEL